MRHDHDHLSESGAKREPEDEPRLSPVERAIERSTIHLDIAACIRWTFIGVAVVILAWSGTSSDVLATLSAVSGLP